MSEKPLKHPVASSAPDKMVSPKIKLKPIAYKIIFYMALRSLQFKRLRTILTTMGVVIGVGSVFLLLSFGLGLQGLVQKEIVGADSIKTIDVSSPNSRLVKLDSANVERFAGIGHVTDIGVSTSSPGKINYSRAVSDAVVYGVDDKYLTLSELPLLHGRMLNTESKREIVINSSLLQALGIEQAHADQAIGKKIGLTLKLPDGEVTLDGDFQVVGVVDSGSGSAIFIPGHVYQSAGATYYSQAKLVIDDKANVPTVRQAVESLGFETASPMDTLEQVNSFFRFMNLILVLFGSIGMLIAILGMLNTLTISLLERTQEIGLMVSLGGRSADMRRLFTAEALLLSLMGGIIGMVVASFLGLGVNLFLNHVAANRGVAERFSVFAYPPWLILVTLGFVCVVGLFVSFVPARRAARINPIDALRHE